MNENRIKTFLPTVDPDSAKWWVIDLAGANLGRTAVKIADILRGKNKPIFTPHIDTGDHVVAINAVDVVVTGRKGESLIYYRYSGYPGGLKKTSLEEMRAKHPERIFENTVKGMLPKNKLGKKIIKKLHIYAGAEHPHAAQKPEELKLS